MEELQIRGIHLNIEQCKAILNEQTRTKTQIASDVGTSGKNIDIAFEIIQNWLDVYKCKYY
jgi:hypothetical protein